ncbi:protein of unknown function [Hyphomicrobium sp. 1Nfss2.1]
MAGAASYALLGRKKALCFLAKTAAFYFSRMSMSNGESGRSEFHRLRKALPKIGAPDTR